MHRFSYEWRLSDEVFTKDKGNVFSCFACGGGSTMGYKRAGFNVLGCNEIDPKMMEAYKQNHNPKYAYLEPIQTFKTRTDLPAELYNLDILDGSPPCSSFSMAGARDADWGKEKKFKEGQALQVLDTLFFDFIDLAEKLRPKVVIAENVKGLILGKARAYTKRILEAFDGAGYDVKHYLLDSSVMGVPQRRERVFFIAIRKDLAAKLPIDTREMFSNFPLLDLRFNEPLIPYKSIECGPNAQPIYPMPPGCKQYWQKAKIGQGFDEVHERGHYFASYKADPNKVLRTVMPQDRARAGAHHYEQERSLTDLEVRKASTFPLDYNPAPVCITYVCGMSVPPNMIAQIATEIYNQWLCKL